VSPLLQACLNGGRARGSHPALPCTADELARDAAAVAAAGAGALHLHPRDAAGAESLADADVAAALAAIRARVPGMPVGISTGAWITPGGRARHAAIAAWRTRPDYVSVNLIEEDAPEVIALARARSIGVEAGLWSARDAERFVRLAEAPHCLRVLIEINEQSAAAGEAAARAIVALLDRAGLTLPRLLHGRDATMWPMFRLARRLGFETRIGLEDGERLPSGARAADNAALIAAARALPPD
jgi:uncharacterized protein (DUF849 family)